MKSQRTKKLYVVGYFGNTQSALYSESAWSFDGVGGIDRMTLARAKKHLKELQSNDCVIAIYKLVPVFKEKRPK
jgi:hypothetical protein